MEDRATWIDRFYHWGPGVLVNEEYYELVAFSDHMGYIIHIAVPTQVCKPLLPHSKRFFSGLLLKLLPMSYFRVDCINAWRNGRKCVSMA